MAKIIYLCHALKHKTVNNKLYYLLSAVLLTLLSCRSQYMVRGSSNVDDLEGQVLTLKVYVDGEMKSIDSTRVVHGRFDFGGSMDFVRTARPLVSIPILRKDFIMAEFWGFTLVQFYLDEDGNIRYDLIDRKHYDPVQKQLLKFQGDQQGIPIENFPNCLFVGTERGLGIFAELMPAVLYKRGDMADWAQFCNIFGMPIREYTYDAGDEAARKRLIADARRQGSNAVYIHPKDSELTLIEAGNKTGSSDLYKTFADYWDSKISIRVLGNTLTTDAKETGTQALGEVHKEEEDDMNTDDREFILDILNYQMRPIFAALGFNVEGGEFVYAKKDKIIPSQQIDIVQKLQSMGLPMDDDWLYETFGVEKPKDYDQQKAEAQANKEAVRKALTDSGDEDGKQPLNGNKKAFKNILNRFFGIAPNTGADTDF